MAKISIASRRKMRQTFPKSSGRIVTMVPQNLQAEIDADFESTNFEFIREEIVKLFSNVNQLLSQQKQIQFSVTFTRTDANKIKIDVNSKPNRNGKGILTSDEVCDMLKIKKDILHKYARTGIIPGVKIGRKWVFEADSIFKLFGEI